MKRFFAILLAALMLFSCPVSFAEEAPCAAAGTTATENDSGEYRVIVRDRDRNPVKGAVIQFCDDATCSFQETDANGVAAFRVGEQKVYDVHVLMAPEGYAGTDDVYQTPETCCDVDILLERADGTEPVFEAKNSGVVFSIPKAYAATKGTIEYADFGDDNHRGEGIVEMTATYIPMGGQELGRLREEENAAYEEKDYEAFIEIFSKIHEQELFRIYGINGGRGADELIGILLSALDPEKTERSGFTLAEEQIAEYKEWVLSHRYTGIGAYDGFTYILVTEDPERLDREELFPGDEEGYFEEFLSLFADTDLIAKNIRLTGGVELTDPFAYAEAGTALRFEATDLEGDPVKSEDLFAGHAVTMINLWGTWCSPCKAELPDLESLNRGFAEKNCRIIGIVTDADNDAIIAAAKEILAESGVSFVNLVPFEGLSEMLPQEAWPTSYFADESGTLVGEPIIGAHPDRYREMVDQLLADRA